VVSVPLAAVFTETNPETGDVERYVYVKQGGEFERRPVQIGVADFFYAEVQQGLVAGEIVAIEAPKSELNKKAAAVPGLRAGAGSLGGSGRAAGAPANATNRPPPTSATNRPATAGTAPAR
jgi:hypothetical protein